MPELTLKQIAQYRQTAERRQAENALPEAQRREAAWAVAHAVADMLKAKFGASKVVVFGSLARESGFTKWSDIDLAVWGLKMEDTIKAMGTAWDMGDTFDINLIDVNCCKPAVLAEIEAYGIEI